MCYYISVRCDAPPRTIFDICNNAARNVGICTVNFKSSFWCSKACRHTLLQRRICRPRECCCTGIAIMHVATTFGIIVMFLHPRLLDSCLLSSYSHKSTNHWFQILIFITNIYVMFQFEYTSSFARVYVPKVTYSVKQVLQVFEYFEEL